MKFTPASGAALPGDLAEESRRNHDRRIDELQRAVSSMASPSQQWELLERRELTAAATEIGFSGLSGTRDVEYLVRGWIVDVSETAGGVALRPNGLTTNQKSQSIRGSGATATASDNTALYVARAQDDVGVVTFEGVLRARIGQPRVWMGTVAAIETATPTVIAEVRTGYWSDTTTEVTSLLLVATATDGFGVGTEIELYRRAP